MNYVGHELGVQPSTSFLRSYKIPRKTGDNANEIDIIPSVSDHGFRPINNLIAMPKAKDKTKGADRSDTGSEESGELSQDSPGESYDS